MYKIYMGKRNSNIVPYNLTNNKYMSTKSETQRSKSNGGKEHSPYRDYNKGAKKSAFRIRSTVK